jgi:hypothetical protein
MCTAPSLREQTITALFQKQPQRVHRARWGRIQPRTAVVEGFEVLEQELIANKSKIRSELTLHGAVWSPDGFVKVNSHDTIRFLARRREGEGESCPEPQRLTGSG